MPGTFTTNMDTNPDQAYLFLADHPRRVTVDFKNSNEVFYDPSEVSLTIYSPDRSELLTEVYSGTSTTIKKSDTGKYYIDFSATTDNTGDYQAVWSWKDTVDGEALTGFQSMHVAPIHMFNVFPYVKNQIDKAQKELLTVAGTGNVIAYNDVNLYMYILGGLSEINRVPPGTALTIKTFPWDRSKQLLVDVSTFIGLQAQGLCAIDTDANYSMQGNTFAVDHWAKISSFLGMLNTRINLHLKQFKMDYLTRIGSVKIERGAGYRQHSIFNAAPKGVNFGNVLGTRS